MFLDKRNVISLIEKIAFQNIVLILVEGSAKVKLVINK